MNSIIRVVTLAVIVTIPAPLMAGPSFGLGVSFIFGGGIAVGAKVFSTDQPKEGAVSLGIDYKLESQTWRPNVGLAYLQDDFYVDLSLGLDGGYVDYSAGIGGLAGMD